MVFEVQTSRASASGGRLVAAAAAVFLLWPTVPTAAVDASTRVTVREEKGVYTVVAQFTVEQPASVAWAVLTDYEQIPRFMPDIRSSIVRERANGRALVEQEAVSGVMMVSKRLRLMLEIEERPDALIFRDRCGRSFVRYEGAWRLTRQGGQTAITYELTAQPLFDVPAFILKRMLRRDSGQMIERLRQEMAARAADADDRVAR